MLTVRDEILLVVVTAAAFTAYVGLVEGDAGATPLRTTAGILAIVVALVIPLVLARRRTPSEPRSERPERLWADVPSWQRRRFWIVLVSSGLLVLMLVPLLVLGVATGADPVSAVPLVLILLLALLGTWVVWRQVRRPDAVERKMETVPHATRVRRTVFGTVVGAFMIVAASLARTLLPDAAVLPGVFGVMVVLGLGSVVVGRKALPESN